MNDIESTSYNKQQNEKEDGSQLNKEMFSQIANWKTELLYFFIYKMFRLMV